MLTAPFLRQRFREEGAYALTVDLDALDPAVGMPYELRVRAAASRSAVRPSPLRLRLASGSVSYVVRPHGPGAPAVGAALDFTVPAGIHRVLAPGVDSLGGCRRPRVRPTLVSWRQRDVPVSR